MKKNLVYLGQNLDNRSIIERLLKEASADIRIADGSEDVNDFNTVVTIGDFEVRPEANFHIPALVSDRFSKTTTAEVVVGLAIDQELPKDWELFVPEEKIPGVSGHLWEIWHEGKMRWIVARGVLPKDVPPPVIEGGRITQRVPFHTGWVLIPEWVSRGE